MRNSAPGSRVYAYFSMEVALDPRLPTYSGGLGVLAGDTLRAAADMAMPVVAVTLLYKKGFFEQQHSHDRPDAREESLLPYRHFGGGTKDVDFVT